MWDIVCIRRICWVVCLYRLGKATHHTPTIYTYGALCDGSSTARILGGQYLWGCWGYYNVDIRWMLLSMWNYVGWGASGNSNTTTTTVDSNPWRPYAFKWNAEAAKQRRKDIAEQQLAETHTHLNVTNNLCVCEFLSLYCRNGHMLTQIKNKYIPTLPNPIDGRSTQIQYSLVNKHTLVT